MALHRLSKPAIAAVDGVAVGAGMNLALGCDVVVATERARFSEIFVKEGSPSTSVDRGCCPDRRHAEGKGVGAVGANRGGR